MEVKRLFDILKLYVENHPNQDVALARKEKGSWKKFSIQEYVETTKWNECQILFTDDLDSDSSKMQKAKKLEIEIRKYS